MKPYEPSNTERKYFGLIPISKNWERQVLNNNLTVYFNQDKIVKILNYSYGYLEYDTDIDTVQRNMIARRTAKGKDQKLTISKLLKIKGCGTQFSISFEGGGITAYDNKRNIFFIRSYFEDGQIKDFEDAKNWINKFTQNVLPDYFNQLNQQLTTKRKIQNAKPGDIIAFKVGQNEYGFARIIQGIKKRLEMDIANPISNLLVHPRSLTVATYALISDKLFIDIDKLITKETLPSIYVFDNEVYYCEMPIIGHRQLSQKDFSIPLPTKKSTSITINYTKTDIQNFIRDNNFLNSLE